MATNSQASRDFEDLIASIRNYGQNHSMAPNSDTTRTDRSSTAKGESKVAQLTDRVAELELQLATTRSEEPELRNRIAELELQLATSRSKTDNLKKLRSEYQDDYLRQSARIKALEQQNKNNQFEQDNQRHLAKIEALEEQAQPTSAQPHSPPPNRPSTRHRRSNAYIVQQQLDEQGERMKELEGQTSIALDDMRSEHDKEIQVQRNTILDLRDASMQDLEKPSSRHDGEGAEVQNSHVEQMQRLEAIRTAHKKDIPTREKTLRDLQDGHQQKLNELKSAHKKDNLTRDKTLRDLQDGHRQKLDELESAHGHELAALGNTHLEQMQQIKVGHNKQLDAHKGTISDLQHHHQQKLNELKSAHGHELAALGNTHLKQMQQLVVDHNKQPDAYKGTISDLQHQLLQHSHPANSLTTEHSKLVGRVKELNDEIAKLYEQKETLASNMIKAEDIATQEQDTLRNENAQLKQMLKVHLDDVVQSQKQVINLQQEKLGYLTMQPQGRTRTPTKAIDLSDVQEIDQPLDFQQTGLKRTLSIFDSTSSTSTSVNKRLRSRDSDSIQPIDEPKSLRSCNSGTPLINALDPGSEDLIPQSQLPSTVSKILNDCTKQLAERGKKGVTWLKPGHKDSNTCALQKLRHCTSNWSAKNRACRDCYHRGTPCIVIGRDGPVLLPLEERNREGLSPTDHGYWLSSPPST